MSGQSSDDWGCFVVAGLFVGLLFLAGVCLLLCFLSWITLQGLVLWILWGSWWMVALMGGLLLIDAANHDMTESHILCGVAVIAGLWCLNSFHNYLAAPALPPQQSSSRLEETPLENAQKNHKELERGIPKQHIEKIRLEKAQKNLTELEQRRNAIQSLLNRTRADQESVVIRMRQIGVKTTADLKKHAQGKILVSEFQQLVGEINSLEHAVIRIEEALVQSRTLIRKLERSQLLSEAGLSDEELKELNLQLLRVEEAGSESLPTVPIDPAQIDAILQKAISNPR